MLMITIMQTCEDKEDQKLRIPHAWTTNNMVVTVI